MCPAFYYHTNATMPADAPCYVERQADRDLLNALLNAQYCCVLDARQVGKSSLITRTAWKLRERGVAVAKIDLTVTGTEVTASQWYNGMLRQVAESLTNGGMPDFLDDLRGFWREHEELGPMQRWVEALRSIVLPHSAAGLVIFVDEVELMRNFALKDEFFAGIRACHNRRVDVPALRRLSFCLAGSATPGELIHSAEMTSFNIGRAITLSDFTRDEAMNLAAGLADRSLLDRIFYWTNGHPYLTQLLCAEVTEVNSDASQPSSTLPNSERRQQDTCSTPEYPNTRIFENPNIHRIDALCEHLFFAPEARKSQINLATVAKRILESPLDRASLLKLYRKVRRGNVVNNEKDDLQSTLRMSGVARARNERLEVRNRIYERVFDAAWIRENMSDVEVRRERATAWFIGLSVGNAAAAILGIMIWLNFRAVRAEDKAQQKTIEATRSATHEKEKEDILKAMHTQRWKETEDKWKDSNERGNGTR